MSQSNAPTGPAHSVPFLSADQTCAIASSGVVFYVGEKVGHQGTADFAVIAKFEIDVENSDIKVFTDKGHCTINFLEKTTS